MSYTLKQLCAGLDVELRGNPDAIINNVNTIQEATQNEVCFLNNRQYRQYLKDCQAGAIILTADDAVDCSTNAIITKNPYYIYACIAGRLHPTCKLSPGIHASAVQGENCQIASDVSIGAMCVIGNNVVIGSGTKLGPHTVIGDNCKIGENCIFDARVTLYSAVSVGNGVHLSSGVVIGSDGFGFAQANGQWHKVPQLGAVLIGDNVAVGANTSIDRGAIHPTVIEEGVKLDNLIQVGHNVKIGAHTVIAGCVAIAGSTVIGRHCMIGGASCFAGHITISDGVMITGMTAVTKSISEPGLYSSGIVGAIPNAEFRKNNAYFHRLQQLYNRVKQLEQKIKALVTERE